MSTIARTAGAGTVTTAKKSVRHLDDREANDNDNQPDG
jgi:hypothetical protein